MSGSLRVVPAAGSFPLEIFTIKTQLWPLLLRHVDGKHILLDRDSVSTLVDHCRHLHLYQRLVLYHYLVQTLWEVMQSRVVTTTAKDDTRSLEDKCNAASNNKNKGKGRKSVSQSTMTALSSPSHNYRQDVLRLWSMDSEILEDCKHILFERKRDLIYVNSLHLVKDITQMLSHMLADQSFVEIIDDGGKQKSVSISDKDDALSGGGNPWTQIYAIVSQDLAAFTHSISQEDATFPGTKMDLPEITETLNTSRYYHRGKTCKDTMKWPSQTVERDRETGVVSSDLIQACRLFHRYLYDGDDLKESDKKCIQEASKGPLFLSMQEENIANDDDEAVFLDFTYYIFDDCSGTAASSRPHWDVSTSRANKTWFYKDCLDSMNNLLTREEQIPSCFRRFRRQKCLSVFFDFWYFPVINHLLDSIPKVMPIHAYALSILSKRLSVFLVHSLHCSLQNDSLMKNDSTNSFRPLIPGVTIHKAVVSYLERLSSYLPLRQYLYPLIRASLQELLLQFTRKNNKFEDVFPPTSLFECSLRDLLFFINDFLWYLWRTKNDATADTSPGGDTNIFEKRSPHASIVNFLHGLFADKFGVETDTASTLDAFSDHFCFYGDKNGRHNSNDTIDMQSILKTHPGRIMHCQFFLDVLMRDADGARHWFHETFYSINTVIYEGMLMILYINMCGIVLLNDDLYSSSREEFYKRIEQAKTLVEILRHRDTGFRDGFGENTRENEGDNFCSNEREENAFDLKSKAELEQAISYMLKVQETLESRCGNLIKEIANVVSENSFPSKSATDSSLNMYIENAILAHDDEVNDVIQACSFTENSWLLAHLLNGILVRLLYTRCNAENRIIFVLQCIDSLIDIQFQWKRKRNDKSSVCLKEKLRCLLQGVSLSDETTSEWTGSFTGTSVLDQYFGLDRHSILLFTKVQWLQLDIFLSEKSRQLQQKRFSSRGCPDLLLSNLILIHKMSGGIILQRNTDKNKVDHIGCDLLDLQRWFDTNTVEVITSYANLLIPKLLTHQFVEYAQMLYGQGRHVVLRSTIMERYTSYLNVLVNLLEICPAMTSTELLEMLVSAPPVLLSLFLHNEYSPNVAEYLCLEIWNNNYSPKPSSGDLVITEDNWSHGVDGMIIMCALIVRVIRLILNKMQREEGKEQHNGDNRLATIYSMASKIGYLLRKNFQNFQNQQSSYYTTLRNEYALLCPNIAAFVGVQPHCGAPMINTKEIQFAVPYKGCKSIMVEWTGDSGLPIILFPSPSDILREISPWSMQGNRRNDVESTVLQSYQDATTSILQNEITNELRKTLASVICELDSVQASNILDNVLLKNGKQDALALVEDTVGSNKSGQSGSDLDSLVLLDTKDVKLTKSRDAGTPSSHHIPYNHHLSSIVLGDNEERKRSIRKRRLETRMRFYGKEASIHPSGIVDQSARQFNSHWDTTLTKIVADDILLAKGEELEENKVAKNDETGKSIRKKNKRKWSGRGQEQCSEKPEKDKDDAKEVSLLVIDTILESPPIHIYDDHSTAGALSSRNAMAEDNTTVSFASLMVEGDKASTEKKVTDVVEANDTPEEAWVTTDVSKKFAISF